MQSKTRRRKIIPCCEATDWLALRFGSLPVPKSVSPHARSLRHPLFRHLRDTRGNAETCETIICFGLFETVTTLKRTIRAFLAFCFKFSYKPDYCVTANEFVIFQGGKRITVNNLRRNKMVLVFRNTDGKN